MKADHFVGLVKDAAYLNFPVTFPFLHFLTLQPSSPYFSGLLCLPLTSLESF